jgi:hypothetical protein
VQVQQQAVRGKLLLAALAGDSCRHFPADRHFGPCWGAGAAGREGWPRGQPCRAHPRPEAQQQERKRRGGGGVLPAPGCLPARSAVGTSTLMPTSR